MRAGTTIVKTAQAFRRDRRGNFGMMMAVVAPLLALSAGYGLNVAQMTIVRSNLLAALDSAVTSTARDLTTGVIAEKDAREMVEAFLHANGGRAFVDADRITLDSLVVDKARGTVSAEASVLLDVAFPLFGAANQQTITVQSASLYSDKKIEIAMMLDVTGSMEKKGKVDKIGDLKSAATNAVNLLLAGQNPKDPRVRVALIPYAEAVNVGKLAEETVFVERAGRSDLPPRIDATRSEINANTGTAKDNCATERKDHDLKTDLTDDAPDRLRTKAGDKDYRYPAKVNRDNRLSTCPKAAIEPLTADASRLINTIKNFSANGVTAGGIGIQWSYYMLSPNWRGAIKSAGLGNGPADHDAKKVAKIAIIMTDGQFNTAFAEVPEDSSPRLVQGNRSRTRSEGLCAAMKADGIEIFTIGFDLNNNSMKKAEQDQAKGVLKNCASPDVSSIKHYYEASTGEELDAAYKAIIRSTELLYLTH